MQFNNGIETVRSVTQPRSFKATGSDLNPHFPIQEPHSQAGKLSHLYCPSLSLVEQGKSRLQGNLTSCSVFQQDKHICGTVRE